MEGGMPMAERRRAKRYEIDYYLQVMDSSTHKVIGNLANVSSVGIMIDGRQQMPVGQQVNITMDTTPDVANVLHIEFAGRVKWCHENPMAPGIFDIGLEFVNISRSNAEILARIGEKYGPRTVNFNF